MSIIFGIVDKHGREINPELITRMEESLGCDPSDRQERLIKGSVAMGTLLTCNTQESIKEKLPYLDEGSGLLITGDVRIDNRSELAKILGFTSGELSGVPDSQLILKAYRKWGESCFQHLKGDFAVAIFDPKEKCLLLGSDPFGIKQLFYYNHDDYFVFSSHLRGLTALPMFDAQPNEAWFFDWLLNIHGDRHDTFYKNIMYVPEGSVVQYCEGSVKIQRYWQLSIPTRLILADELEYVEGYREVFKQAVNRRVRSAYPVGAELSGGLDSSSIAAVAHSILIGKGKGLHAFSRTLPEGPQPVSTRDDRDEWKEIRMICDHLGIGQIHRVTLAGERITSNIDHCIELTGSPYPSNYAAYNLNLFHEARAAGVRTILSGHGGDQMVTNKALFVHDHYIREHRYSALYRDLRAKGTASEWSATGSFFHLARLMLRKSATPVKKHNTEKLARLGINGSLIHSFGLKERFLAARAKEIIQPEGLTDLIAKITDGVLRDRIEVTSIVAGHDQVEYRYPMFDVDLINYFLSLPYDYMNKFHTGRYIHRMAMQDILPENIRLRRDKSVTINPGLEFLFCQSAGVVRKRLFEMNMSEPMIRNLFEPRILEKILIDGDENMFKFKAIVNKINQLRNFSKIVEKILALKSIIA